MERSLMSALCSQRVPPHCPFCDKVEGIIWSEFRIHATEVFYFDRKLSDKVSDEYIKVFCSRCDEEIREEDL